MKRLFYGAGIVLTLSFFGSCAQHDPSSPDTSGGVPYGESEGGNRVGVDTVNTGTPNVGGAPNTGNDGTNNNQRINTGDTSSNRQ
jgi:hypothetical protein